MKLRDHFVLKCDKCKWIGEIDTAYKTSSCPNCGYKAVFSNMVYGTIEELTKYIKDFLQ